MSSVVFSHGSFSYVINFSSDNCWIIDPSDSDEPIEFLHLRRGNVGEWFLRHNHDEAEFIPNFDVSWSAKLEQGYSNYIKMLVSDD